MIVCPSCGEENPEHARFCLACGSSLVAAPAVGEERKVVSVLFVDLVGFTSRSDRADPEDVRATLRPYHERVKSDIERFGGTVEKFIGDAVMAVFGAPVAHEDDAERAVRAALRILETIEELRDGGLEIAVRAAVTTGETVVALGARPERGEGIATGDVVNIAARLQAAAPAGSVVVDSSTMRATEAAITFESLEPVVAKGKADPILAWRALDARSRVGQPEAATRAPFIGREHERNLLLETFLRAERESSAQLVTVVGEPGIGKSRLVTELRTTLDDRPEMVTWRHGRCLPYGEGITFWALGEIVKAEAGILESDNQEETVAKLDEMVSGLFADEVEGAWFTSRLAPLVGAGSDGETVGREESFTAWRRFLEAMAARRSCVFVVEDLHWADEALLDFLEHLLDWASPVPLLVLASARPELYDRRPEWSGGKRNATTISLSPLTSEETARLLQSLLERTLLPAEMQVSLLERAGGNPLYAEQFARMLTERGDGNDMLLPETVQSLIAARLDTLTPDLKALLQDASVVGRTFWTGAVAAIERRDRDAVLTGVRELVRREFVRPSRVSSVIGDEEFSIWHALVRDVAYRQIPRARRAEKHVAAAAWIEGTAQERVADHAEILVHHYGQALELAEAAGDDTADVGDKLARALILAGDRAIQLDIDAAATAYRRATEVLRDDAVSRAVATSKLGAALLEQGAMVEAIAAYEEAISVLRREDEERMAAPVMRGLARVLWHAGETARARAVDLEAVAILERDPGPELVQQYGAIAMTETIAGRQAEALEWTEKGFALAKELGVEDVVRLLQVRGAVRGEAGDARAVDDHREALELARRLGVSREVGIAYNNLASWVILFQDTASARALFDEGIAFTRSRGATQSAMWIRGERLICLYDMGDWGELMQEAGELERWAEEHVTEQIAVFAGVLIADVLVHRGSLDVAASYVERILSRARQIADLQAVVPALTVAALVDASRGEAATALAHIAELERVTRGAQGWRADASARAVRACLAAGDRALAATLLDGAEHPAVRCRHARMSARAALAEAEGARDEAAALYAEAADGWDAYGHVVERAYALLGIGRCGADEHALHEGHAVFERLAARPILARAA